MRVYFHNGVLVFSPAIDNVHPSQFSSGHVPGNERAGSGVVHDVNVHALVPGALFLYDDFADFPLFDFRRCSRAAAVRADAEQVHDKNRDQKQK